MKTKTERMNDWRPTTAEGHTVPGRPMSARQAEALAQGRRAPFEPGNDLAVTHGAHSEARIRPLARAHRRRVLRQLKISPRELSGPGRGYLDLYARNIAKVQLLDEYLAQHGLLTADGEPQACMRIYTSLCNTARLSLARLEAHVAEQRNDPAARLIEYLDADSDRP